MEVTILVVVALAMILMSSIGAGAWYVLSSAPSGAPLPPPPPIPPPIPPPPASKSNRDPSKKCHGKGKDEKLGTRGKYWWNFDNPDVDLYTCPGYDNWCCKLNADGSLAPGWGRPGPALFAFEKFDSRGCGIETGCG